jgi:hypothetical protein
MALIFSSCISVGGGLLSISPSDGDEKKPEIENLHDDFKKETILRVNNNVCQHGGSFLEINPAQVIFDAGKVPPSPNSDLRLLITYGNYGNTGNGRSFNYSGLDKEMEKPIVFFVDGNKFDFATSPPDEPIRRAKLTGSIIETEWIVSGITVDFLKNLATAKDVKLDVYGKKIFGIQQDMSCEMGDANKALISRFLKVLESK